MILSANEVYHFKKIIRKTNKSSISKLKISNEDLEPLVEKYEKALQSLEELIKAEKAHGYKTVSSELKDTNEGQVSQSPEQQSD